jgi:hypothetical protein
MTGHPDRPLPEHQAEEVEERPVTEEQAAAVLDIIPTEYETNPDFRAYMDARIQAKQEKGAA